MFSLQITNVSVGDDADFECQVGPANYNSPIRGMSHLSVLRKSHREKCSYLKQSRNNDLFCTVLIMQ